MIGAFLEVLELQYPEPFSFARAMDFPMKPVLKTEQVVLDFALPCLEGQSPKTMHSFINSGTQKTLFKEHAMITQNKR